MTLLERLKELNDQGRGRKDGEDLGHWADRNKHENLWVRDIALPLLLELAEAAKALRTADVAFYEAKGVTFYENRRLFERTRDAEERLDAVLAKLEVAGLAPSAETETTFK